MKTGVVVAHYKEDLSWIKNVSSEVFVISRTIDSPTRVMHNKGNEACLYFEFIINHYDSLPDKMLFVHGHQNSYHQDFPADYIANNLLWDAADYFSVNRRDYYQRDFVNVSEWRYLVDNKNVFEGHIPFPENLRYYSCAQFVVDKKCVLRHSKETYQHFNNWLINTNIDNFISARVFEYTWHYIFTGDITELQKEYSEILSSF